jgi:hypothetical protein
MKEKYVIDAKVKPKANEMSKILNWRGLGVV